ncbi:hypothetical protein ANN_01184 [Periplaneta americana]|uniref:Uncharacterized protein n=1 Tax=Periplaneta americana TaxID=6978 RepID=A0ABQ8TVW9_PERAM|nr:hypothetical protein ANN_01184 [Periplaneta americana]
MCLEKHLRLRGMKLEENGELHALYSSPDIIRNIISRSLRWAGHVAHMGEHENVYTMLVEILEGKKLLGRPRRRWEDNIKTDLREVEYDGWDWINLAQDRDQWRAHVKAAMNLRILLLKTNVKVRDRRYGQRTYHPHFGFPDFGTDLSPAGNGAFALAVLFISLAGDLALAVLISSLGSETGRVPVLFIGVITTAEESEITNKALHREQFGRRDQVTWTGGLRRLEEIGMEFIIKRDCRNKRNVWRRIKKRLKNTGEEKKELVGSLADKKLSAKRCIERNYEREKSSGRRRHQMTDGIKIYGSYAETKRKAENRKY